jgi:DNA repair exonuclease SbcCD ATPase subunit/DNA repair exonuclease SbcCD nuclease subunit
MTTINTEQPTQLVTQSSNQQINQISTQSTKQITIQEQPKITVIPYKSEIKHIYHLSDIHIHLYKRHREYELVFDRVLDYLREERKSNKIKANSKRDISMICVITGDILHSKSDLSPECIALTYKFLKDLLDLLPVVVIPGNHDLNMNNKERLDSLTPIICDLPQHYPIHYLNKTGCWLMGNLLFSHASIFDYHIISPDWIDTELSTIRQLVAHTKDPLPDRVYKVALYHGRVNGAQLFNGLGIDGEHDTIAKRTITPSSFDGYDLALLGDIHKQQFLDPLRNTRGYAGSLIQQNLGEDLTGHGLVKWSLGSLAHLGTQDNLPETNHANISKCGQFIPIPNDFGYMTFRLVGGKNDYEARAAAGTALPKNLRVRVLYSNTIQSQVQEFIDWLSTKHTVIEYSCQNDEPSTTSGGPSAGQVPANGSADGEPAIRREFDINNVEYQNQLLEEIIRDNFSARLADGDLDTIKTLNRDANRLFNDSSEEEIDRRITLPGQRFKLLRLEFDNLFSYGEGNVIDFSKCKGVVGIVAANHMGKSAILDIILYGLFDKFTRKGNVKDMINNRKTSYKVRLVVQSGIWKYTISKSGKKTAAGTGKNECTFTRQNISTGREENLAKDTAKRTREYICEVFGNFEDMINTNFSIQTNSTGFIDADNSSRRAELEKILRFDFLTDLAKQAGKQYNDAKSVFEHLQKTMPAERINTAVATISDNERQLSESGVQREKLVAELAERQTQINNLHKNLNPDADTRLDNLLSEVDLSKDALGQAGDGGSAVAILNQVGILETEKAKIRSDLDGKLADILTRCQNPQLGLIPEDLAQLNLSEEDRTSSKAVKKWRDAVKQQVKKCQISARESMREAEEAARSVGVQITQKRQTLQRYSTAKPNWTKTDFETNIKSVEEKKACLSVSNEELATKQDEHEKQREKCDKYRRVIEEARTDLDQLQSREQIPEFLKTEFFNSADTQTGLTNQISEFENDLSENYHNIKPVLLQLGWFQELGSRVKASTKADEKAIKYRSRIDENKGKLEKAEKRVKALGKEIAEGQKLQVEYHKLEQNLLVIQQDLVAFESNQTIIDEIREMELMEQTHRKASLNDPRLGICDEITQALVEYTDLDSKYKDTKTKLKALGGIQGEIDELLVAVERNNTINSEIVTELSVVKSLTTRISELDIRMEKYKDTISGLRGQLEKMREDCVVKIQKEKLMNIYSVYRDALKLIPIVLISKVQPVIERKVNDLLSTITDFSVKFSMEDNKIDIYLDRAVYAGEPILINNSSGFERFISSLAIRIALLEISQLPSPNFIAIDEGWSCFDNENIANMDVILGHLGQKFDFILTISHLQVIRQHCDIQITLRRTDAGFSQVSYGV